MEEEYTFERFWKELADGYQIYYTHLDKRYVIYKVKDNCYKEELQNHTDKSSQPRFSMLTLKRVKEIFPYMTDIEYKVT